MRRATQTAYNDVLRLAEHVEDNFLDLADALNRLAADKKDRGLYDKAIERAGLGQRKTFYLLAIARQIMPLAIPRERLQKIGWTKLSLIARGKNEGRLQELIDFAEQDGVTVKKLEQAIRKERPTETSHCVLMYFTPRQYARLEKVLLSNGATKSPRGLVDKEKALLRALGLA